MTKDRECSRQRHNPRQDLHKIKPGKAPPKRELFEPLLDGYIEWMRDYRHAALATLEARRNSLQHFLRWLGPKATVEGIADLSAKRVESFFLAYADESGLHARRQMQAAMRTFLQFCFHRGYIQRSLEGAVPTLRTYKLTSTPRGLSEEESKAVLQCINSDTDAGRSRRRTAHLAIGIGIVGALLTIAAWLLPRRPAEPPPAAPAIYAVRVQVLDPDGRPVTGSTVRVSAGNEPHLVPDGWWEVEVAAAKLPQDRRVTIWAEHPKWQGGRVDLELGMDQNPRAEVRLKVPESSIRGTVVDVDGRGVAGARVTPRGRVGKSAVTDQDGRFELTVAAPEGESVRVHVEHPDFQPGDGFCYAGRDECPILLEVP